MDKETLSNYGWIVICVLILAVMIALATPFGSFVSEAVQSTTKELFDVNKNALDAAGIVIPNKQIVVPNIHPSGVNPTLEKMIGKQFKKLFRKEDFLKRVGRLVTPKH